MDVIVAIITVRGGKDLPLFGNGVPAWGGARLVGVPPAALKRTYLDRAA
jgi:hypothetical protein